MNVKKKLLMNLRKICHKIMILAKNINNLYISRWKYNKINNNNSKYKTIKTK